MNDDAQNLALHRRAFRDTAHGETKRSLSEATSSYQSRRLRSDG
jgi:hypothetical protein